MTHGHRTWHIREVDNALDLALLMRQRPWPANTGFRLGDYLILNDSMTTERLQVYTVVLPGEDGAWEIERIEVANLDLTDLVGLLEAIEVGEYNIARWVTPLLPFAVENGRARMIA